MPTIHVYVRKLALDGTLMRTVHSRELPKSFKQ